MVQQLWASRAQDFIMNHACFVVDLRDGEAFRKGHLPKAVQISETDIENREADLPLNLPIVVYCSTGSDSLRVARLLSVRGYRVYNLVGGYEAYLRVRQEG